jgi:hypothetical protein
MDLRPTALSLHWWAPVSEVILTIAGMADTKEDNPTI